MKKIVILTLALSLAAGVCAAVAAAGSVTPKETTLRTTTRAIVKKQVKSGSSKKAALKQLFQYAEKNYGYKRVMGFKNTQGWEKTYAQEIYKEKKGSCYHFAAAYAFLAKEATGYPVRICIGTTNGFNKKKWQNHAWTEIKIGSKWYLCDPNLDKFGANSSGKYYLKLSSKMKNRYKTSRTISAAF